MAKSFESYITVNLQCSKFPDSHRFLSASLNSKIPTKSSIASSDENRMKNDLYTYNLATHMKKLQPNSHILKPYIWQKSDRETERTNEINEI